MLLAVPTCHDEVKPFLGHAGESQDIQTIIRTIAEMGQPTSASKPHSPSDGLFSQQSTVETATKVLRVFCLDYAGLRDFHGAAMAYRQRGCRSLTLICTVVFHAWYYSINPMSAALESPLPSWVIYSATHKGYNMHNHS